MNGTRCVFYYVDSCNTCTYRQIIKFMFMYLLACSFCMQNEAGGCLIQIFWRWPQMLIFCKFKIIYFIFEETKESKARSRI